MALSLDPTTGTDSTAIIPDATVTEPEQDLLHVSMIHTLPAYTSALSLEDSTAIPNVKWNALLDKLQDENEMINIAEFEARLEVLGEAGMRPPKSSGVGNSSNRSANAQACAKEVNVILKKYNPLLADSNELALFYVRQLKEGDKGFVPVAVVGTDEEE